MISGRCNFLKKWPEWDASVHNDDSQISRQGRAMTYPFTFEVDPATETARFPARPTCPITIRLCLNALATISGQALALQAYL